MRFSIHARLIGVLTIVILAMAVVAWIGILGMRGGAGGHVLLHAGVGKTGMSENV